MNFEIKFEKTKIKTTCLACGEQIELKCKWYNQIGDMAYLGYKMVLHYFKNHKDKLTDKGVMLYIALIKETLKMIPFVVADLWFSIWWLIGVPFRFLFG